MNKNTNNNKNNNNKKDPTIDNFFEELSELFSERNRSLSIVKKLKLVGM
jgi:hypothetical protein